MSVRIVADSACDMPRSTAENLGIEFLPMRTFLDDVEYLDGDIVFYNEYKVPANPPTGDDTPIHLFMGLMAFSAMAMMAMLILDGEKRKHF